MSDAHESMMFRSQDDSESLMILCSGRRAGFHDPLQYSMAFATRKVPVNRLYLRDNFGMWYHQGQQGVTSNFEETTDFLKEYIETEGFKRVTMLGVSSGGYASLVWGTLLDVDEIHAFGPPTLIDRNMRDDDGSNVSEFLHKLHDMEGIDKDLFDLRTFFTKHPRKPGRKTMLYYDPEYPIDVERVDRIKDMDGMETVECPGFGHKVLRKYLKDRPFFNAIATGEAASQES